MRDRGVVLFVIVLSVVGLAVLGVVLAKISWHTTPSDECVDACNHSGQRMHSVYVGWHFECVCEPASMDSGLQ